MFQTDLKMDANNEVCQQYHDYHEVLVEVRNSKSIK